MRKIVLSDSVQFTLDDYFQNYSGTTITDMPQRAYHYSRMIYVLTNIDLFFDEAICINNQNYISINNIFTVEFAFDDNSDVIVKEIYFNHNITQPQKYNF
jgi:hypothetical protein